MADNVAITAGTGTNIATDDAGAGGHVQIVKLAIAANGSATVLPGDATDGLLVNLGANNDVTVTGSTTVSGTVAITKAGAAARTSVASGTSNVTILAANANRLGASIYNDDANALLLGMGGTDVTSTNYTVSVPTDGYFEVPFGYTGIIEGLWESDGSGSARVTEYTAS